MKLSIITPSYNQGQFIGKTFSSILQQTCVDELEYIIVDAVSTDETAQVIQEYLPKFEQHKITVKVICESDKGQSDAINKGWNLATGDIITYLNSDDYYESNVLQAVLDYFTNHSTTQWAYGGWNLVNRSGKVYTIVKPTNFVRQNLLDYDNIGQPSCFFRKTLLDQCGRLRQDYHLAMDYDLWLRFLQKYEPAIIPKVIANMRYYADAKSAQRTKQQVLEMYHIASHYTKPLSYQRFRQYFFVCTGWLVSILHLDISRRIDRMTQ
ncbi:MAG: glycosyltransferase family 2 protein [Patescibacteria group bacterium]